MKTFRFLSLVASAAAPFFLTTQRTAAEEPSPAEIRTIAGEAYAYGLPLVMAYTASYEFWLNKASSQYKNPINRYLINAPMLPRMKKNDDGSLTIHIGKDSPGPELEANWLPAPDGPIYMVMRLYWPKTEAPSILPPGEGTWNPPGLVKVK